MDYGLRAWNVKKTLAKVGIEPGPPRQKKLTIHIGVRPLGPTGYPRR